MGTLINSTAKRTKLSSLEVTPTRQHVLRCQAMEATAGVAAATKRQNSRRDDESWVQGGGWLIYTLAVPIHLGISRIK